MVEVIARNRPLLDHIGLYNFQMDNPVVDEEQYWPTVIERMRLSLGKMKRLRSFKLDTHNFKIVLDPVIREIADNGQLEVGI